MEADCCCWSADGCTEEMFAEGIEVVELELLLVGEVPDEMC